MIFPFSVQFNRSLKAIITADNKDQVLRYIEKSIIKGKADNVVVGDMTIYYKGSSSNSNWSLFRSVDDGIFKLLYKDNAWILNYQINMRRLFIGTAILSTIMGIYMGVAGGFWWVGIVFFLCLCGGNWIINLIRHGLVATNIAVGIDELICGKTEPEPLKQDKITGKLKSWF